MYNEVDEAGLKRVGRNATELQQCISSLVEVSDGSATKIDKIRMSTVKNAVHLIFREGTVSTLTQSSSGGGICDAFRSIAAMPAFIQTVS